MASFITMDESKLIFVSFEQSTGGYGIARTICTLPDVYWYSHPDNGKHPWNVSLDMDTFYDSDTYVKQRLVTPRHFDRWINGVKLPPTWDYVKDYFPDHEGYLRTIFFPAIEKAQRQTSKKLVFTTHLSTFQLRQYFGTSACLNVLYDPLKASKRHLLTTSKFLAYNVMPGLVEPDNEYIKFLETIRAKKPDFTNADVWAMKKHYELYDDEKHRVQYHAEILEEKETRLAVRKILGEKDSTVCTIHQDKIDWKKVKTYLNSL